MTGKWDFIWATILKVITSYHNGTPILFLGNESKKLRKYCFELSNPIYELIHPSNAARNQTLWDTKKVFSTINKNLDLSNGEGSRIYWARESSYLPF